MQRKLYESLGFKLLFTFRPRMLKGGVRGEEGGLLTRGNEKEREGVGDGGGLGGERMGWESE